MVSDAVWFLGFDGQLETLPLEAGVEPDIGGVGGPTTESAAELAAPSTRIEQLESCLRTRMAGESKRSGGGPGGRREGALADWVRWLPEWTASLSCTPGVLRRGRRAARKTLWESLRLTVWRGTAFYGLVGLIFAAIFLFIFWQSLAFLDTGRIVVEFGPQIVLRLAPPFAAILVAAVAGSAVSAWVGPMSRSRQLDALEVLGVNTRRHLTGQAWIGLVSGNLVGTAGFAAALVLGFSAYLLVTGEESVTDLLRGFETPASAVAALKTLAYGTIVASVTIYQARKPKKRSIDVAAGITRAIAHATVWVMLAELGVLAYQSLG